MNPELPENENPSPKNQGPRPWETGVRASLDVWDVVRGEAVRGWKILLRLLKGSQLTHERRKILQQLGALAADRIRDGRWTESAEGPTLAALMDQLERLDRKVHLEERLIAKLRHRGRNPSAPPFEEDRR